MAEAGAEAKTEVLRLEAHFDEERGKSRTPKVLSVPELAKFERNLVTGVWWDHAGILFRRSPHYIRVVRG